MPAGRFAAAAAFVARLWFPLLLGLGIAFRLYHFTHLPDDAHEWRQTQTLMYAASYGQGAPWLAPQGWWFGATPHPAVLEFPIYSIVVALISPLVGLLPSGRLATFGLSLAAIWLFDRLCRELGHPRRRTATVLFALSPILVFYGHAVQPEPMLLALLLASLYAALRAERADRRAAWWFALSAISLAGASIIKPTALLVAVPVLLARARGTGRYPPIVAVLGIATVATGGWALYVRHLLTAASPVWYATATRPEWLYGPLSLRWSPSFYRELLFRVITLMLPPLAALGLIPTAVRRMGGVFWWAWLAGGVAGVLIFAELNFVHFYYQLLLIPPLAALAALGLPRWPRPAVVRAGVVACLAGATIYGALWVYATNPIYYDAGRALARASRPDDPVLVLSRAGTEPSFPSVLFYAGRRGWNLPLGSDAGRIAGLPGPRPCVMAMVLDGPAAALPAGYREEERTSEYVIARRDGCQD